MGTGNRLEGACESLDLTRQDLEALQARVRSLGEGSSRGNETISRLQQEVAAVGQIAARVEAGLQDTNAMVLPNLHKESDLKGTQPSPGARTPRSASRATTTKKQLLG